MLWKTPYNEHNVRGGTVRYAIEAVRRGYAFIVQNERGRYFSQGLIKTPGRAAAARLRGAPPRGTRPEMQ